MRMIALLLGFACIAVSAAMAETIPVDESFRGTSMPAGFHAADTSAPRQIEFSTTYGALFGANAAADDGRNYIRTDDANYHTVGFIAELTIKADTSAGGGWPESEQFFFGLGTGAVGQYGVPDRQTNNPSIYIQFNPATGNNARRWQVDRNNSDGTMNEGITGPMDYPAGVATAVHRLQMIYDEAAQTATFSVHYDYAGGPFVAHQTSGPIDVSSLSTAWAGGAAAAVFFGGDSQQTASPAWAADLSIQAIPEPATWLLAVLGLAAVAVRGRRWKRSRRQTG